MAALFFWLFIVPLAFCVAGGIAISKLAKLDEPLDSLPVWRRLFRKVAVPGYDDTPEQARLRYELTCIKVEGRQANRLINAIGVSSQIGRGRY